MNDKKIILAINRGHNASATLVKENKIVFHIENERLSNLKYDSFAFNAISLLPNYVDYIDVFLVAGVSAISKCEIFSELDYYSEFILRLGKSFSCHEFVRYDFSKDHHKLHAACSFYNSGFESALCIVKDGMGSDYLLTDSQFLPNTYGRENGSVYLVNKGNFTEIQKHICVNFELPYQPYYVNDTLFLTTSFSEGLAFQKTSKFFKFHELDAGKVMGLSSYGKSKKYPIYKDNFINDNIFKYFENDLTKGYVSLPKLESFQDKADFSFDLQSSIQENVLKEILKLLEKTNQKNLCLSGGFFLNCVANYYILSNLPSDINLYIEPVSNDAGTTIGAVKMINNSFYKKRISSLYLGPEYNYTKKYIKNISKNNNVFSATAKDVALLLADKKIIAIYQGRSEAGPRALGNRSILYDPRDPNGKNRVNTVKMREWFRPFAATILQEYAKEWFDLKTLDESPYMMFAVSAHQEKINLIPAVLHVDNTCRIQTLKKEQNNYYYELIKEFYKITNIPMTLNTSFNLAGNCIVETIENALDTLNNSEINYLYLPEFDFCIGK